MMWKAQGFSNEISSNWGNVISSIQALPALSLQLCPGPAPGACCSHPAHRRVVCTWPLRTLETAGRIFSSSRLTKALAGALQVLPSAGHSTSCPRGSCPMESSKVGGQDSLWNHKLLKVLKTKIISSHDPQWRGLSAPVGWVGTKCINGAVAAGTQWLD